MDPSNQQVGAVSSAVNGNRRPSPGSPDQEGCLVLIYGRQLCKPTRLGWGRVEIGRLRHCEIPLEQDSVSRRHALIWWDGSTYRVKDLASRNGTYVNDDAVTESELHDRDLLKVGSTVFKFLTAGNVETAYHREMYHLIGQDCLTSTYNDVRFQEILAAYVPRCLNVGTPLTLIMFDVDHFQRVNDDHGNLSGDSILKELVTRIQREFLAARAIFARCGGNRFALLVPDIQVAGAADLAERMRLFVERSEFAGTRGPVRLSASFAVAELDRQSDPAALFRRSNDCVRQAKLQGGNQVVRG